MNLIKIYKWGTIIIAIFLLVACAPDPEPPGSSTNNNQSITVQPDLTVKRLQSELLDASILGTELQYKETMNNFAGTRVHWYFRVGQVREDGTLEGEVVDIPSEKTQLPFYAALVKGLPLGTVADLDRRDIIEIEATISFREKTPGSGAYALDLLSPNIIAINPTSVSITTKICDNINTEITVGSEIELSKWGTKKVKSLQEGKFYEEYYVKGPVFPHEPVVFKFELLGGKEYTLFWDASGEQGIAVVQDQFGEIWAVTNPDKNGSFQQFRSFIAPCSGNYYVFVFDIWNEDQSSVIQMRN